jgi:hypothetical protein
MNPTHLRRTFFALFAIMLLVTQTAPAGAWYGITHTFLGNQVLADLNSGNQILINGHSYSVRSEVANAIRNYPAFYNAGIIGPDGFPDISYGQGLIHSVHTGTWLRYLHIQAWNAQSDPDYSTEEKAQILAFTYGFLGHAAMDVWGHTIVNDFSGGAYPPISDVQVMEETALIVPRHIVIEAYVADLTPGYDKDNSPSVPFDVPTRFLYQTLIDPAAPTPADAPLGVCSNGIDDDGDGSIDDGCPDNPYSVGEPEVNRGPIIDYFLDLQAKQQIEYAKLRADADHSDCWYGDLNPGCKRAKDTKSVSTVRGIKKIEITTYTCKKWRFICRNIKDPVDKVEDVVNDLLADYLGYWIDDIEAGLQEWPLFGLGVTRGLFDPQTRNRAGGGAMDSILYALDHVHPGKNASFTNEHLIPMLGLPDAIGDGRGFLMKAGKAIDKLFDSLGIPNPIKPLSEDANQYIQDMLADYLKESYDIDLEAVDQFLNNPSPWMCGDDRSGVSMEYPGLGRITPSDLFTPEGHARLDSLLGLPPDHHIPAANIPEHCAPVKEDAVFDIEAAMSIKDSIVMAKLLLLDGSELNRALGDVLVEEGWIQDASLVQTYATPLNTDSVPANIMIDPLGGQTAYWLESILGDHAWRQDGMPLFCPEGPPTCPYKRQSNPNPPPELLVGGNGHFPIWESCLLRPAFRGLFNDWENGSDIFPDLGDEIFPDPSDPETPTSSLTQDGPHELRDGQTVIFDQNTFTLSAVDTVFRPERLNLQYRIYKEGSTPGEWQLLPNGGQFVLPPEATEGTWHIDYRSEDPCHTFVFESVGGPEDLLPPEPFHTTTFILDLTEASTTDVEEP